jgi:hypothetical protein
MGRAPPPASPGTAAGVGRPAASDLPAALARESPPARWGFPGQVYLSTRCVLPFRERALLSGVVNALGASWAGPRRLRTPAPPWTPPPPLRSRPTTRPAWRSCTASAAGSRAGATPTRSPRPPPARSCARWPRPWPRPPPTPPSAPTSPPCGRATSASSSPSTGPTPSRAPAPRTPAAGTGANRSAPSTASPPGTGTRRPRCGRSWGSQAAISPRPLSSASTPGIRPRKAR